MDARPRPWAVLLSAAAFGAVAWPMYRMMLVGSCSIPASELPACPPGTGWHVVLMLAGLAVLLTQVFGRGRASGFFLTFGAIGLAGILAGLTSSERGGQRWYLWFGLGFLLGPLTPLLGVPAARRAAARQRTLTDTGIPAVGTVLSVRDTGVTVNNDARLVLRFRIEPVDGFPEPFEAEQSRLVSRLEIPRAGERYPVWIDRDDHTQWAYVSGPPDANAPAHVRALWEVAHRAAAPVQDTTADDVRPELARLAALREAGRIDDAEFAERAAALVARP